MNENKEQFLKVLISCQNSFLPTLPTRGNFLSILCSVFYVKYSMRENQKHHLNCALNIIDLMYSLKMQSSHVVIFPKKNIDSTNMENSH